MIPNEDSVGQTVSEIMPYPDCKAAAEFGAFIVAVVYEFPFVAPTAPVPTSVDTTV